MMIAAESLFGNPTIRDHSWLKMGVIMRWINNNRFLVILSMILIVSGIITFFLGKPQEQPIENALQGLASNLTAEIAGALVAIWVIDYLLKQQQAHSLRNVTKSVVEAIRLLVYEVVEEVAGTIADPAYEVLASTAFNEILDAILDCNPGVARIAFDKLFAKDIYYPSIPPSVYSAAKTAAAKQLKEVVDLQVRYQPYLSPVQFLRCTEIINGLKTLRSHSLETEKLLQRLDGDNQVLTASQIAPQLVKEIKAVTTMCLDLLKESCK